MYILFKYSSMLKDAYGIRPEAIRLIMDKEDIDIDVFLKKLNIFFSNKPKETGLEGLKKIKWSKNK